MLVFIFSLLHVTRSVSLSIITPQSVKDQFDSELDTHLGNYGHIAYGNTIVGRLHYPVSNRNGCSRFNKEDFSNDYLFDEKTDMTPLVLLDHGECSYVQKTKNA